VSSTRVWLHMHDTSRTGWRPRFAKRNDAHYMYDFQGFQRLLTHACVNVMERYTNFDIVHRA
jgi:hypothetical protein